MEKNEPNQNKYDAALAKYNTQLDDTEVAAQVAKIIAEKVPGNHTEEVKKFLFHCIDLTTLNTTDSDESVMKFTQKVNQFDEEFPDLENVAAICVYPNFAEIVKSTLEVEDVKIACVSAGFPSSQTFTEVKVAETAMALMEGADEIDIVISVGKFLSGDYENMCEEIQELNRHNEHFEVPNLEGEQILRYFRKPAEGENGVLVTTAYILERISGILRQPMSAVKVGIIMKKSGFKKAKHNNLTGYIVVENNWEDMDRDRKSGALGI